MAESTKLRLFLNKHEIALEHLLDVSRRLERRRRTDRQLALARKHLRRSAGDEPKSYAAADVSKPRSGRGLGRLRLGTALAGGTLPRQPRAKLIRAVNAILTARGTPTVGADEIFDTADVSATPRAETGSPA